jgi:hypothetical protein
MLSGLGDASVHPSRRGHFLTCNRSGIDPKSLTIKLFDSRPSVGTTLLGVHVAVTQTLLLFLLSHSTSTLLSADPLRSFPAVSIRPVRATRAHSDIRDLAVQTVNGNTVLLVADGIAIDVNPDDLDNIALPEEGGPLLPVLHALSAVLKTEEMARVMGSWLANGRGWNGLVRALQGHVGGQKAAQTASEADFLSLASLSLADRTVAGLVPPIRYPRAGPTSFEVLKALHLVYEDLRLVERRAHDAREVGILAGQLALSLNAQEWVDRYSRDGLQFQSPTAPRQRQPAPPPPLFESPPDLFSVLLSLLVRGSSAKSTYPELRAPSIGYFGSLDAVPTTTFVLHLYSLLGRPRRIPNAILDRGFQRSDIESLGFGVGLPIREALRSMQISASDEGWGRQAYELIGREDLAALDVADVRSAKMKKKGGKEAARFSSDLRVKEVERMLQYTRPVTAKIPEKPGIR